LPEAVAALRHKILPLAYLVTPNLPEAEALAGLKIENEKDIREAARRITNLGVKNVLIKGGHLHLATNNSPDFFFEANDLHILDAPRIPTVNSHGTGCTLSAAITALLARNFSLSKAVKEAKEYLTGALAAAPTIGAGHSPVAHFYRLQDAIFSQLTTQQGIKDEPSTRI
jgi:hydroxymethylpyrimidine/phosphomethylpyrimidine kinase